MQTAFDEVWSAQPAVDRTVSESDGETLANAILALVNRGERDPAAIKNYALDQLSRFRNPDAVVSTRRSE